MEIAIIGILLLGVAIWYGLLDSLETGARMGNRRLERLEAEQIKEDVEYYNSNAIDSQKYETAVEQKTLIKTYRSM